MIRDDFDKRQTTAPPSNGTLTSTAADTDPPTALPDYDFVVVGSGAGGGPLAARLAINGYSVLLLESGDDQGAALVQQVPALQLQSTEYEPMRWDYFVNHYNDTRQQQKDSKMVWKTPGGTHAVGLNPPAGSSPLGILYPRAGTLGGCTAHNAMITVYPHEDDWNNIASLTGDSSWSAENMRTYFERLERVDYLPNGIIGHGFSGWLNVQYTSLLLVLKDRKVQSLITAAATATGAGISGLISTVSGLTHVLLGDVNADLPGRDGNTGLYQVPIATSNEKRTGSREFIVATQNAQNPDGSKKYQLDVRLHALVTKVRFDTSGARPKAIGVDFLDGQSLYRADPRASGASGGTLGSVNATKEVIISAGAFNSPQLLKLSGIGPQAELKKFNIPVVVNLPGVGTNLQDRYETGVVGRSGSNFSLTEKCTFLDSMPDPCLDQWQNNIFDKGTYATNGIAIGIVHRSSTAGADPDLFIAGVPADFRGYYPGYSADAFANRQSWTWVTLKAHSRNDAGTVTLRSADPRDTPQINFNSFGAGVTADGADEKDLQAVMDGMKLSRQIFEDLVPFDGSFEEVWPGPAVATDGQLADFVRDEAWGHHASCTCPIGADGDPAAVLDSAFRVRGVDGLRVVDASAFPKIPGFYIAVPTYMLGEKAAEVITQQYADDEM